MVTCQHLLQCVWGMDVENKIHDLHVYIRSLRKKLDGGGDKSVIQTEGSAGYRLLIPDACQHNPAESITAVLIATHD
jgi:DNA-binding response OmpR family regulator